MAGVNTLVQGATTSAKGPIEIATNAEAIAGISPILAITADNLKYVLGNSSVSGWNSVLVANFTETPASTSTITMISDLTSTIKVGLPLKYTIGGTNYYGVVSAITSNLLTVNGAPLGGNVTALYYGDKAKRTNYYIIFPGSYEEVDDTDLIGTLLKTKLIWRKPTAYIVGFKVYSVTKDTSSNGKVTVQVNNQNVCTTEDGLTITDAETWLSTVVDISSTYYDINYNEELEISVKKGTAGDGEDLTVVVSIVEG